MSVASEFPPEVYIPERARREAPTRRHLVAVPVDAAAYATGRAAFQATPQAIAGSRRNTATPLWRSEPVRVCNDEVRVFPAGAAAPLRLTRRGVAVLVAAGVLAAGLFLLVAHASLGLAPSGSTNVSTATSGSVVVQNGDTLWSIAQRVRPTADPREVVDQLRRVNHLKTVALSPGQTLKVG